jgi:hypothetical protein
MCFQRSRVRLEGVPDNDRKAGWIYQGVSTEAFNHESYLGPFNGHINGGLVMKELHRWVRLFISHYYINLLQAVATLEDK